MNSIQKNLNIMSGICKRVVMICLLMVIVLVLGACGGSENRTTNSSLKSNGMTSGGKNTAPGTNSGEYSDGNNKEVEMADYNVPQYAIKTMQYVKESENGEEEPFAYEIIFYNCNDDALYRYHTGGLDYEKHYDTEGELLEVFDYNGTGSPLTKTFYENGLIKERYQYEGGTDTVYCSEYWQYNSEGKNVNYEKYHDNLEDTKSTYIYENGLLSKKEEYVNNTLDAWEEYTYDENGKRAKMERYYYFGDELRISCTLYEYDEHGNRIKEIESYQDGSQSLYKEWAYHDNHKIKTFTQYVVGTPKIALIWNYDTNENIIEQIDYSYESIGSSTVHKYRTTYAYDAEDRRIETVLYNSDGSFRGSERVEYIRLSDVEFAEALEQLPKKNSSNVSDAQSEMLNEETNKTVNLITEQTHSVATTVGKVKRVETYYAKPEYGEPYTTVEEYDEQGNVIKTANYKSSGELAYSNYVEYEYNKAGTKIGEVWSDDAGNITVEHTYDEHGNETGQISYAEGTPYMSATIENEYDSFGNLTATYLYVDDIYVSRTEYEYDTNGNAILEKNYQMEEGREICWETAMEFDTNGELVSICYYDDMGKVSSREEWNRIDNTKSIYYGNESGGVYLGSHIEYDDEGHEISIVQYYEDGNSYRNEKYTYECSHDTMGNEILLQQYQAEELIKSVTKEFF